MSVLAANYFWETLVQPLNTVLGSSSDSLHSVGSVSSPLLCEEKILFIAVITRVKVLTHSLGKTGSRTFFKSLT